MRMRLTEEDVKILNKIVEKMTIDEILEEASVQAERLSRILSTENRQNGLSKGSYRIAGDIAVNLGIIYFLADIAARKEKNSFENASMIYSDDFAENEDSGKAYNIDDMLHNLVGCTMGLQMYRKKRGREFLKNYVDNLDKGFRDAARALMDQLLAITDKVLGIKKKDFEDRICIKIQEIGLQEFSD